MKASEWMLNMTVINVFQYNDDDARLASVVASRARESEPLALLCFALLRFFNFICSGACASALRFTRAFAAEHHNYPQSHTFSFLPVNRP